MQTNTSNSCTSNSCVIFDHYCRIIVLQHIQTALLELLRDRYLHPPTFEVLGTLLLLVRCQIQALPTGVRSLTTVDVRT